MGLSIDWHEYDELPVRERYDAIGGLIDEVKAAVAARRAEIAHGLAAETGAARAAEILGVSATRVYGLAARHRQAQAAETTCYVQWSTASDDGSERTLLGYVRKVVEGGGLDAERFDLEEIRVAYRDAIQAELPEGIEFTGSEFVGSAPVPEGVRGEIRAAVARVDLWEIVARHDPDVASS